MPSIQIAAHLCLIIYLFIYLFLRLKCLMKNWKRERRLCSSSTFFWWITVMSAVSSLGGASRFDIFALPRPKKQTAVCSRKLTADADGMRVMWRWLTWGKRQQNSQKVTCKDDAATKCVTFMGVCACVSWTHHPWLVIPFGICSNHCGGYVKIYAL